MDNVTATLVNEVLALQAEVAAQRIIGGAVLVDDPVQYISMAVENIEAYSLQMALNDAQREVLRARLEYTRELWVAHMREAHPGGWLGLRYWLARTLKRIYRVFAGSTEFPQPPAPAVDWVKLGQGSSLAATK